MFCHTGKSPSQLSVRPVTKECSLKSSISGFMLFQMASDLIELTGLHVPFGNANRQFLVNLFGNRILVYLTGIYFSSVYGITTIMSWPVLYISDKLDGFSNKF